MRTIYYYHLARVSLKTDFSVLLVFFVMSQGGMRAGVLTARGRHQAFCEGLRLREKYIEKYKILNPQFQRREIV